MRKNVLNGTLANKDMAMSWIAILIRSISLADQAWLKSSRKGRGGIYGGE